MGSITDTTRKVYRPLAETQTDWQETFSAMRTAYNAGNLTEGQRLFKRILEIEREQREAAQLLRQHISDRMATDLQKSAPRSTLRQWFESLFR